MKLFAILLVLSCYSISTSGQEFYNFSDTSVWKITDPSAVHIKAPDRQILYLPSFTDITTAYLKNYKFKNGIIEVDMNFLGHHSYNGLIVRMDEKRNFEYFYFRPQSSGKMEAVQYAPAYNNQSAWQVFSGPGYNASNEIPKMKWTHVKVVVNNNQAELYLDDMKVPAVSVHELKNCCDAGTIGVLGHSGGAFFSNFKVTPLEDVKPLAIKIPQLENGIIKEWMVSQVFSKDNVKGNMTPKAQNLKLVSNKRVTDSDGILNVTKHMIFDNEIEKRIIYVKTSIISEKDQLKKLSLGYSDNVEIYLNDVILFEGVGDIHNRYEGTLYRNSAEGILLNLKKGRNELVIGISDLDNGFGGNGIQAALNDIEGIKIEAK